MDAVFVEIAGAWVCCLALVFALMSVARRADDANDHMKFDVVPIPDHVEARWSPSPLGGRRAPSPSRFDVVAL